MLRSMTTTPDYLFVYGSLRRDVPRSMHRLIAGHTRYVGRATIPGRLYRIGRYPGWVATPGDAEHVVGEVYKVIGNPAELIARLDDYEGCGETGPGATHFLREAHPVTLADGRTVDAWVYRYAGPTRALTPLATGDWADARPG